MSNSSSQNNSAINSIELVFFYTGTDINIVNEVKEKANLIASNYGTTIIYDFREEKASEKVKMEMYNHITPNQYLTEDFFKFYEEFLKYTNEVEEKYPNFVTLPMD